MAPLQATITVTVVGGALVYTVTGDGIPVTLKKHRVKKRTQVQWCSPQGELGIIFVTSPFTGGTVLSAAQGGCTGFRTTKNRKKTYKYTAVLARPGLPLLIEDPELDVSDDPGGGLKSKRKPAKKNAPKKKK